MKFEFYVINEDFNRKDIVNFNIFQNWIVQERTEKAVKKYLRSPKNFKYIKQYANSFIGTEEIAIYGFDGFVAELDRIIRVEECARCEYEVSIGSLFTTEIIDIVKDLDKYTTLEDLKEELKRINERNGRLYKWDCYMQCKPNMVMIAHEVIRQYKEQSKKIRSNKYFFIGGINMFKSIYMKFLKHLNFDKWWKLHCSETYCKNCSDKYKGCFVDYQTGKCVGS